MIEYGPTAGPNLYCPRLVRVVSGIQTCVRCDSPLFRSLLQAGWGFQECQKDRTCGESWWSLALPPDAPAGHLCAIMGEDVARVLLAKAFPLSASLEPPELWGYEINPSSDTAWVQVAVRPRERHLHRTSKLTHILTSLLREAA